MDVLNSNWLIKMLAKSGKTPHARMLGMFDVLADWLEAPSINAQLQEILDHQADHNNLRQFLMLEAEKAGAAMPEMLANQLYFMAVSAMQDRLINQNADSLSHAKSAANALILAQTKNKFHINKSSAYALAASFIGILVVAGSLFIFNTNSIDPHNNQQIAKLNINNVQTHLLPVTTDNITFANPEDTVALIAQIDQMRKGNCQLIEAIQLPDSYKRVYFENIVLGQISTNLADQKLVRQLLEKVRCNYTPMLMANSR